MRTRGIEHIIHSPQQIFTIDGCEAIDSLQVRAADGSEQMISFTEPLALVPAD